MTARELTRRQIEALIVARALVHGDHERFLLALDRSRVSLAVFALLERMGADIPDEERGPQTKGQRELANRVRAVTVWELMRVPVRSLLQQAKQLPTRPTPAKAWERDLAVGIEQETAA